MLQIRRFRPEDEAAVKKLHYAGIEQMHELDPVKGRPDIPNLDGDLDDIEKAYINNRGDFLVGLIDNEIVAIGGIRKYSDTCGEIKRIRIRRDCQRRGYGEAILVKLANTAAGLGYTELCLDTMAANLPAQRLFEKTGFRQTGRGRLGQFPLIFYRKNLADNTNK
jgi:ribosomal protein S18 acetylase RimI-like enzyme